MDLQSLPKLLEAMRRIDDECMKALAPQFPGGYTPVGSQWDYDSGIAQARMNQKRYLAAMLAEADQYNFRILESALIQAQKDLFSYIEKKNLRYKKDPTLQRDLQHGQHKLQFDHDCYTRALAKEIE